MTDAQEDKGDDEISIDFSKIKNFFKREKEEKAEEAEAKAKEEPKVHASEEGEKDDI